MATYYGSGRFVAVTASNNGYDYIQEPGMHGITFGRDEDVYCTISPHYELANDQNTITDASLNIESGIFSNASIDMPLYIAFPNLKSLKIGNNYGYTGEIEVANTVSVWDTFEPPITYYKTYRFYCGILTNV